jgi:hypothetical protein
MKKVFALLIILLVILVGVYYIYSDKNTIPNEDSDIVIDEINSDEADENNNETDEASTTVTTKRKVIEHFTGELRNGVIERIGQPIEGFTPQLFMQAYPGLVPEDFNDVDALLGKYEVLNGSIEFIMDEEDLIHSAYDAISDEGMLTLLNNIEAREDLEISTLTEVDGLMLSLGIDLGNLEIVCLDHQRNIKTCHKALQPVCASVNVRCITEPCPPVKETFDNLCLACTNSLVSSYTEGECSVN